MSEALFKSKAPWIMALLMQDFPLGIDDSAAILGNIGHECGGFSKMQEEKPTKPGSRGGFGWPQWTGPRRRQYEAYCKRNNLDPRSDIANYKFMFVELMTTEKHAIPAVVKANGLEAKVKAFELAFERAGVKHYPSRLTWARRALDAFQGAPEAEKVPPWQRAKNAAPERPQAPPKPAPEPAQAPAPPPARPNPSLVKMVQRLFREKGYPEIGNEDGILGGRTRDVVLMFQAKNGMKPTGEITPELLERLANAPTRTIASTRAEATEKDISDATGVQLGKTLRTTGLFITIGSTILGVIDGTASLDDMLAAVSTLEAAWTVLADVSPWLLLLSAGLAGIWLGRNVIADHVRKYRAGNHV